jgi:hypothetical protein
MYVRGGLKDVVFPSQAYNNPTRARGPKNFRKRSKPFTERDLFIISRVIAPAASGMPRYLRRTALASGCNSHSRDTAYNPNAGSHMRIRKLQLLTGWSSEDVNEEKRIG